jgi:hypothetical protein
MFFGEYDATAEEEQSLQDSKMGKTTDRRISTPIVHVGISPGPRSVGFSPANPRGSEGRSLNTLSPGVSPGGSRAGGSQVGEFEKQSPLIKL